MVNFLNKHCSIAFNSKHKIYRGVANKENFLYVDPRKSERQSANTNNIYNLLLSNMPSWSEYPKRSKSIICSSDTSEPLGYGRLYVVYPIDGAKMGVCPGEDVWLSFQNTLDMDLSEFNSIMLRLFNECSIKFKNSDTYKDLVKNLSDVDIYIKKNYNGDIKKFCGVVFFGKVLENLFDKLGYGKNKSLFECINNTLTPKKNGFKLVTAGSKLPDDNEVWISAPCVLVREDYRINYEIQ